MIFELTQIAMSPLLWIGATVTFLLIAIYVGETMPRRWQEICRWLPIALLALLALRPYPRPETVVEHQRDVPAVESRIDPRAVALKARSDIPDRDAIAK